MNLLLLRTLSAPLLSSALALGAVATGTSGCAAMAQQYNASLDQAVTVSPVDQRAYSQVAMDSFVCSDAGYACEGAMGQLAADQLAMTMGRLGYQVFDSAQFMGWLAQPPTVVVAAVPPMSAGVGMSASLHVGPDGAYAEVGGLGVSASADASGEFVEVHSGGGVVVYESLPLESRQIIMERSGIAGVVSGRVTVAPADDVTGWREVHVMIRLSDASTGALVWQGEWRETAMDGETPESALSEAMQHLERGLQRRAPLG